MKAKICKVLLGESKHCARDSLAIQDLFTSLTSASKPHHMLSESGVILGYSHFGMLAAARWVLQQTKDRLEEAMTECPGYHLQVVGHSLGAGTAALLTTRSAFCIGNLSTLWLASFGEVLNFPELLTRAFPPCLSDILEKCSVSAPTEALSF